MYTDFKTPFHLTKKWIGKPDHEIASFNSKSLHQPRITRNERKSLGLELLANCII